MDDQEYESDSYQRVYKYISCHEDDIEDTETGSKSPQDCLKLLLQ